MAAMQHRTLQMSDSSSVKQSLHNYWEFCLRVLRGALWPSAEVRTVSCGEICNLDKAEGLTEFWCAVRPRASTMDMQTC